MRELIVAEFMSPHVYPLALGGGKRLFADGQRSHLKLAEAKPLPNGVVYMWYRYS
jgi:hypothetical protein